MIRPKISGDRSVNIWSRVALGILLLSCLVISVIMYSSSQQRNPDELLGSISDPSARAELRAAHFLNRRHGRKLNRHHINPAAKKQLAQHQAEIAKKIKIESDRMMKRNERLASEFLFTQKEIKAMEEESKKNVQGRDQQFRESVAKFRKQDLRDEQSNANDSDSSSQASFPMSSTNYDQEYQEALQRERKEYEEFQRKVHKEHMGTQEKAAAMVRKTDVQDQNEKRQVEEAKDKVYEHLTKEAMNIDGPNGIASKSSAGTSKGEGASGESEAHQADAAGKENLAAPRAAKEIAPKEVEVSPKELSRRRLEAAHAAHLAHHMVEEEAVQEQEDLHHALTKQATYSRVAADHAVMEREADREKKEMAPIYAENQAARVLHGSRGADGGGLVSSVAEEAARAREAAKERAERAERAWDARVAAKALSVEKERIEEVEATRTAEARQLAEERAASAAAETDHNDDIDAILGISPHPHATAAHEHDAATQPLARSADSSSTPPNSATSATPEARAQVKVPAAAAARRPEEAPAASASEAPLAAPAAAAGRAEDKATARAEIAEPTAAAATSAPEAAVSSSPRQSLSKADAGAAPSDATPPVKTMAAVAAAGEKNAPQPRTSERSPVAAASAATADHDAAADGRGAAMVEEKRGGDQTMVAPLVQVRSFAERLERAKLRHLEAEGLPRKQAEARVGAYRHSRAFREAELHFAERAAERTSQRAQRTMAEARLYKAWVDAVQRDLKAQKPGAEPPRGGRQGRR